MTLVETVITAGLIGMLVCALMIMSSVMRRYHNVYEEAGRFMRESENVFFDFFHTGRYKLALDMSDAVILQHGVLSVPVSADVNADEYLMYRSVPADDQRISVDMSFVWWGRR